MNTAALGTLITRYTSDPESVYNTWFLNGEERMKAFRSIRRGVRDVVDTIAAGTFGNDFKGSPLEFVLTAITEQKQVFEGAAHPFYWKPKLRIPDIYENEPNKQAFAACLEACVNATREEQVMAELNKLASAGIKGLGPAVASIVYFLHPTIVPPCNTAIVNGFNAVFSDKQKLGSWPSYFEMRETIVQTNGEMRELLSKDLGAIAGLLFDVGSGRLVIEANAEMVSADERAKAHKAAATRHKEVITEQEEESEHTKIQYLLIKIGRALGYAVHVARNDRHRAYDGQSFALLTVPSLPTQLLANLSREVADTVSLIDAIWFHPQTGEIVSAFEVEKSTSIYSGILRLEDLAHSLETCGCHFYLVAPDVREREVMAQLARPSFRARLQDMPFAYIPFSDLCAHCDALCRFGDDHKVMQKIARSQTG